MITIANYQEFIMATVYEELHILIDNLSAQDAENLLQQIQGDVDMQNQELNEWLQDARKLREELKAEYGSFSSAVDILHEVREER
jgi:hypothetical protein